MSDNKSPIEPEWDELGIPVDDDAEPEDADLDDGYEVIGDEDE